MAKPAKQTAPRTAPPVFDFNVPWRVRNNDTGYHITDRTGRYVIHDRDVRLLEFIVRKVNA